MKRTITLTVEQAKELYEKDNSFRDTLLSEFTDVELAITPKIKTWGELKMVEGFIINHYADGVTKDISHTTLSKSKSIYATKKQVLSAFAMAQLSQYMADFGDECDVDWGDEFERKWTISRYNNALEVEQAWGIFNFLAFKTKATRDAFLEKHEELIKQYFMI